MHFVHVTKLQILGLGLPGVPFQQIGPELHGAPLCRALMDYAHHTNAADLIRFAALQLDTCSGVEPVRI